MIFKGINVTVGITGGIAAYKICELVSMLKKNGASCNVIMTENASKFVTPLTFETITNNEVLTDTFERKGKFDVEHISVAKKTDLLIVAPATANFIGKIASGICDDMLTTVFTACRAPKLICPSMNTAMYENEIVQKNIKFLLKSGINVLEPETGHLACGDTGKGRLADVNEIYKAAEKILFKNLDFSGKTVLVTAGATCEYIDAVRFISNFSSGKMGFEIAKAFKRKGADVVLVKGRTSEPVPNCVDKVIEVLTTEDMYNAVMKEYQKCDIIVKAAAPADYKVENISDKKIKSQSLELKLVKNPDIAAKLGEIKGNRILVIFSAETENLEKNAYDKLIRKKADMVVANDITKEGAGFNVDTNIVTVLTEKNKYDYDKMKKSELAQILTDRIKELIQTKKDKSDGS